MDEILTYLKSPGWWFSTVVVGCLLTFTKPLFDLIFAKYSARKRKKIENNRRKNERLIEFLESDTNNQIFYSTIINRSYLVAIICLIGGVATIVIAILVNSLVPVNPSVYVKGIIILDMLLSALMFSLAFQYFLSAFTKTRVLYTAYSHLIEPEPLES